MGLKPTLTDRKQISMQDQRSVLYSLFSIQSTREEDLPDRFTTVATSTQTRDSNARDSRSDGGKPISRWRPPPPSLDAKWGYKDRSKA